MDISAWINRMLFGAPEEDQNTEEDLIVPVGKTQIQLAVYQTPYKEGPMATVRYTCFGEDGKPVNVQQMNYGDTAEELARFDIETTAALEMGADVTIFTRSDVDLFPKLSQYTKT